MPIFEYKAFDRSGATRGGIIDADSARDARTKLRGDGIHVVDIHPLADKSAKGKGGKGDGGGKRLTWRRVDPNELTVVTRQLGTLLKAGITIADALKALIEQVDSRDFERVFRDVREKVTQGETLGEALSHHPAYFSDLYVNMVKAGEASGHLDEILARLAQYLTRQNRLRNKISSALTYPIVMIVVGAAVVMVLMTVVVPNLVQLFGKVGKALPTVTVILIKTSRFFQNWWWTVLLAAFLLYLLRKATLATEEGRLRYDRMMMRFPVLGDLIRKNAVNRFATTTAILLKSGIPVLEALKISKNVVQNAVISRTLGEVHDAIIEGSDIATPLQASGAFPSMVGYMIATGEQSGQLDDILERISEAYDEEVEFSTQRLTAVLEPAIIVSLALVVGFVVIAIVLPLLQMGSLTHR
ncbi:MAG TPA: type II secretion system inner membrane protein GspF [Planctomycetota bacterium]|nr:type II secretion system inner membrane protein GspF [Planctomycetota bacterium]